MATAPITVSAVNTTAIEVITRALRSINVLGAGETPDNAMSEGGLLALNELIGAWSNENLLIYAMTQVSFPFVPGQGVYTFGPGGNFNAVRPMYITSAFVRWQGVDTPVAIISNQDYDNIPVKVQPSAVPYAMVIDTGFPLTTLTLYPQPNTASAQLFIQTNSAFTEFATLTDPVVFPPGYEQALRLCLGADLMSEYGITNPRMDQKANNSKRLLKRANYKPQTLRMDSSIPGQWNGLISVNGGYSPDNGLLTEGGGYIVTE